MIEDPIQVMFNGGPAHARALRVAARQATPTCRVSLTEYVHRDFSLVDITNPIRHQGPRAGLASVALGLVPEQVMAIGDNFNDLEMLEFAGMPVVMGNAVEPLKRGWFIRPGTRTRAAWRGDSAVCAVGS